MSLTTAQKTYYGGSIIVGGILAIVFGILAGTSSGGNQTAYIAACIASGLAGIVALIIMLVKK